MDCLLLATVSLIAGLLCGFAVLTTLPLTLDRGAVGAPQSASRQADHRSYTAALRPAT